MDPTLSLEFSWICDQFLTNENLPSSQEVEVNPDARRDPPAGALLCEEGGPTTDGGSTPGSPAISPSLQTTRENENAGPTTGSGLRGTTASESECPQGGDIWIREAAQHNSRSLCITQWDLTIETDASTKGWGASCQEMTTVGAWTAAKRLSYIKYLELCCLPGIEGLSEGQEDQCAAKDTNCVHQQDGRHPLHCPLGSSSVHFGMVLGEGNHNPRRALTWHTSVRADWESHHIIDSSNWMLWREVLQLEQVWGPFSIVLFAS